MLQPFILHSKNVDILLIGHKEEIISFLLFIHCQEETSDTNDIDTMVARNGDHGIISRATPKNLRGLYEAFFINAGLRKQEICISYMQYRKFMKLARKAGRENMEMPHY